MSDFSLAEDAIRAWVKAGSGLTDPFVFFRDQPVEYPASTFVTIKLPSVLPMGAVDPVRAYTDLLRPPGQEIELRVEALRELSVSVQVWKGRSVGPTSALEIGHRIQASLRLPSVHEALNEAGLSPFDSDAVTDLSAVLGTDFQGRAEFMTRFYARFDVSEFNTYIQSVEITNTSTGITFVVS